MSFGSATGNRKLGVPKIQTPPDKLALQVMILQKFQRIAFADSTRPVVVENNREIVIGGQMDKRLRVRFPERKPTQL